MDDRPRFSSATCDDATSDPFVLMAVALSSDDLYCYSPPTEQASERLQSARGWQPGPRRFPSRAVRDGRPTLLSQCGIHSLHRLAEGG